LISKVFAKPGLLDEREVFHHAAERHRGRRHRRLQSDSVEARALPRERRSLKIQKPSQRFGLARH
jgi:hypothetical protein